MTSGVDLLRSLGAGVNGPERVSSSPGAVGPADGITRGFASMLEQARARSFESGLPVRVAQNAGVELSEEQLARLGPALDRLHASGASHALLSIDGRLLKVDVLTREVRGEFDPASGEMVEGIDAVASVPPAGGTSVSPLVGVPSVGAMSSSLARALEKDAA